MRNRNLSITALTTALLLTACANGDPLAPDTVEPTPPAPTVTTPTPDPTGGGRDDIVEPPTSTAAPATWDAQAEQDAIETAIAFIQSYLDTSQPEAQWLDGISPYLHPEELAAFSTIDPMNIPYGAITGAPQRVTDDIDTPYLAVVAVPVDDTALRVTLARDDGAAPWLVVELAQG